MNDDQSAAEQTARVPLGGDYWQVDPGTELWGFADLHAHLMAHLTFGGNAFWGQVYDPERTGDEAMEHAMPSCEPIHGGLINVNPEIGHPAGGGWPDFIIWPRFTTLIHQQAYVDWIYRAYQGGLRLITCLAVNNEMLGTHSNPKLPTDDKSAIERQVIGMKQMIVDLDRQAGGPGQSWMQIAYSAEEARAIVKANKLAIVLGVEVDSLGNWRRMEDLQKLCGDDLDRAREIIERLKIHDISQMPVLSEGKLIGIPTKVLADRQPVDKDGDGFPDDYKWLGAVGFLRPAYLVDSMLTRLRELEIRASSASPPKDANPSGPAETQNTEPALLVTVRGVAKSALDGKPITGARVGLTLLGSLEVTANNLLTWGGTNAEGEFELNKPVPPGRYTLKAKAIKHQASSIDVEVVQKMAPLPLYDSVFSVGAIDQGGDLAVFSSRGPVTADGSGRVKPDIVAPGVRT